MHQEHVLILGGRGRLGLAAVQAFAQAGWRVTAQVRPGADTATMAGSPQVRWLAWDLQDTAGLARAAGPAQVVLHALNPSSYSTRHWSEEAPALMDAAIGLARRLDARLMFPGNVYNFGSTMPELLAEDTPQQADTAKGRIRIALEQQLAQAVRSRGLQAVVVRAGDFFGAGRGTWFDRVMVKDLDRGRLVLPGAADTATAWAYVPDLARTFVRLAQRRSGLADFETFHFAGHTLCGRDWAQVLDDVTGATRSGRGLRTQSLPWWMLRLLAPVNAQWAGLVEMRYLWQRPHRLKGDKLHALLGELPSTPITVAAAAALRDLGLLTPGAAPTPPAAPALAAAGR